MARPNAAQWRFELPAEPAMLGKERLRAGRVVVTQAEKQIGKGSSRIGVEVHCPAIARQRVVQPSQIMQSIAQVIVCVRQARLDLQREAVACKCFLKSPELVQQATEVVVRLGELR